MRITYGVAHYSPFRGMSGIASVVGAGQARRWPRREPIKNRVTGMCGCEIVWDEETSQRMDEMVERATGQPCPGRHGGHCPILPRAVTEEATDSETD